DYTQAIVSIGFDMLDIVDGRRQSALELRRHTARHLIRRQAGILPDDRNDRDTNVRKNVDRGPQRRKRTDDQDDEGQHYKRVRPLQRYPDNGDHVPATLSYPSLLQGADRQVRRFAAIRT